MVLLRPTRRELLTSIPLLAGAASFGSPLFAATERPLFNFLVVGDWGRGGKDNQGKVAERMGETAQSARSSFIASTGDNFYRLGVTSVDDRQWRTSFEEVYTHPGLRHLPWYPVLGNHDYGGSVKAQIDYKGPTGRWKMAGRYYPLLGGPSGSQDADFFFIDTVTWLGVESFPYYFLGSDIRKEDQKLQAQWLVEALASSKARFKFVFGHHGIYSIGPHGGQMQMKELDDVLRRFCVTAYIHGHDHCLYHISHRGMHYICSGGGSQVLATYTGGAGPGCVLPAFCNPASGGDVFPRWQAFIRDAGFASFNVYANRVEFDLLPLRTIDPAHHWALLAGDAPCKPELDLG